MDIANMFKWTKERAEDTLYLRFMFWYSIADIALNIKQRRYYRMDNTGPNVAGGNGNSYQLLVSYLDELNLTTVSPKILKFIMAQVVDRGRSMSRVEANFVPIWPAGKPQPTSPTADTHIGALFYSSDGHWYICLNQKHFAQWYLSGRYPKVKYDDVDPLNPKNASYINGLNNKINTNRNNLNVDTVVTDLSDPADTGRYVDIDLKNFHGGGIFSPVDRGTFTAIFEKYAKRQWYVSKYKVPWKKPLTFTPLHEVKLLTPNLNLASTQAAQTPVKSKPKQITASQPRLLIGNRSYNETVASLKISSK